MPSREEWLPPHAESTAPLHPATRMRLMQSLVTHSAPDCYAPFSPAYESRRRPVDGGTASRMRVAAGGDGILPGAVSNGGSEGERQRRTGDRDADRRGHRGDNNSDSRAAHQTCWQQCEGA